MSYLELRIDMDNAAFADTPGYELHLILTVLADRIRRERFLPGDSVSLFDTNGNRCGLASFKEDE